MRFIIGKWAPHLSGDAVWFHNNGYESSQNNRHWCAENCMLIRDAPLHGGTFGVWCAVSATRIIRPFIFLRETKTLHRCDTNFWHGFFLSLVIFFSKITYTAMNAMYYVFGDNTEGMTVATFTRSIPVPFLFVEHVEGHSSCLLICRAFKRNYRHTIGM
jgi:hypothetical protein